MDKCEFTIRHWRRVIRDALDNGYRFYTFRDWITEPHRPARSIILRHDIDVTLELAARQARTEAEQGVRATYFVRIHSKLYRPDTASSRQSLRELGRLGAEIGLHYEPQYYQNAHDNPAAMLAADARLLGDIAGANIEGCSAHRVGTFSSLESAVIKSAGLRYDAFTPEFVKDRKYISDSSRNWREGCLCRWLGKADHLTVLTHPVWWFEPADIKEKLLEQLRQGA